MDSSVLELRYVFPGYAYRGKMEGPSAGFMNFGADVNMLQGKATQDTDRSKVCIPRDNLTVVGSGDQKGVCT